MKKVDEYLTRDTWGLQHNQVNFKRDEFEKWAQDQGFGTNHLGFRRSGHCYHDSDLEWMWRAWQKGWTLNKV